MIDFVDIHKRFGEKQVLCGASLSVGTGEVQFIIGTSGAGKSVLVKHLIGLIRADAGRVWLDGEDITDLSESQMARVRKKCAMVFQHATLFDSMTLAENVALPIRKHQGVSQADALAQARDWLTLVQLEKGRDRYPAELGEGMRKRVAIARALTMKPEFLVLDEPTTGLDPVAARNVDALIRRLSDEQGVTSIVVSHDLRSIFGIADQIAMVYQGVVRVSGTALELRQSEDPVLRQFLEGRPDGPME